MINISKLAKKVGGSVEGDSSLVIHGIGDLKNSPKDFLTFLSDNRYYDDLVKSKSEAVIVNHDFSFNNLETRLLQKLCISPDLSDLVKKMLSNFFPVNEVSKA